MYLKFCEPKQVGSKRQLQTIFKAGFLAKLLNMKRQGQELELNFKVENWIDENINKLYNNYLRSGQNAQLKLFKSAKSERKQKLNSMI